MFYKVLTIYDRLTRSYEPIFEARTIDLVRQELLSMCAKTARKPQDYEIVHIADIERTDTKEGYMTIKIIPVEEDVIGTHRYEVIDEKESIDG